MNSPTFLYGTAWKEDTTQACVQAALNAGFRGIDTANQRKHYFEAAVGNALKDFYQLGTVSRKDIFLQTKYTHQAGQDRRLPYDPKADIPTQVQQSFASSLEHLHTVYIDSYVLHGPSLRYELAEQDWEAWSAMEKLQTSSQAKVLGVSNVNIEQLTELYDQARVKPRYVQNRCYAITGWDREVRAYCKSKNIAYQGFSLLTANMALLQQPLFSQICANHKKTAAQLIFSFAQAVGMICLTGTTDPQHMQEDLAISEKVLDAAEVNLIESLLER